MARVETSENGFVLKPHSPYFDHLHNSHDEVDEVRHPAELLKGVEHLMVMMMVSDMVIVVIRTIVVMMMMGDMVIVVMMIDGHPEGEESVF